MAKYSISEIERLTQIKAPTLRIWEKRYGLTFSKRTENKIRFYEEQDLLVLLQITNLIQAGFKISTILKMTSDERKENIIRCLHSDSEVELFVNQLIVAMFELNENLFHMVCKHCFQTNGVEETMIKVIYPFLERIGLLWITENINPAREHFVSNLIRQKLIAETDKLPVPEKAQNNSFLLFLPEGELHEVSLLLLNYMLRRRGNHTLYLGQNTPLEEVAASISHYPATYVCTILTSSLTQEVHSLLQSLEQFTGKSRVVVGGRVSGEINKADYGNIDFISSASEVAQWIEDRSPVNMAEAG
ncbi:MAG: MerR family transcriptional regulator [Bacteroidia bacterium]|nr:MerR family transcriptional regulator [Bacteroidia bacterium]